jgi:hypothetical protein
MDVIGPLIVIFLFLSLLGGLVVLFWIKISQAVDENTRTGGYFDRRNQKKYREGKIPHRLTGGYYTAPKE